MEHIGSPDPLAVPKRGLDDDGRAATHGRLGGVDGRVVDAEPGDGRDREPARCEVRDIGRLMTGAAFAQDLKRRVLAKGTLPLA